MNKKLLILCMIPILLLIPTFFVWQEFLKEQKIPNPISSTYDFYNATQLVQDINKGNVSKVSSHNP